MIQDVLTYSLVIWAFYQVVVFFYRIFKPTKQGAICSSGGCPSCDAKTELFNEIRKGKFPTLMEDKTKELVSNKILKH